MTAQELLNIVLPRLAGGGGQEQYLNFLEAVRATADIITKRLWFLRSDLLETDFEALLAAGEAHVTLGADFLGLVENSQPWLDYADGTRRVLTPLPNGIKHTFTESGPPRYYELRGRVLTVFPTTSAATTVKGEQFSAPAAVTALTDNLPFSGIFDPLFVDAVTRIGKDGLALTVNPAFAALMYGQVDQLVHARPAKSITWRYPA
jgi:hypothetical protein